MDYQRAKREAPKHFAVLERHLDESSSAKQVDFPYEMVARAFPSYDSRPESFDYNFVEHEELMPWAKKKGWDVEQISRDKVRFTKISE
ncbi:MAG: hypothetical protein OXU96_10815 [Gammaproteobacteria bacterium]|nr:hypothetical protein [Gammaproteobacteria bacterium]